MQATSLQAISDSDAETANAFKGGSNFVLRRPFSESSIDQTLGAAYGLILCEHRRYFRCPVELPVTLRRPRMTEAYAHAVNISEGGIEIVTSRPLANQPGGGVRKARDGAVLHLALNPFPSFTCGRVRRFVGAG